MSQEQTRITRRFSVFQFVLWSAMFGGYYVTTYLKEIGFSGTNIGLIVSVGSLLGSILLPLLGRISDKTGSARWPFLFAVTVTVVLTAFLPLITGNSAARIVVPSLYCLVIMTFKACEVSLSDSLCLERITPWKTGFATVRIWGTIGYLVISVAATLLLLRYNSEVTFYLSLLPFAVLFVMVLNEDAWEKRQLGAVSCAARKPDNKGKTRSSREDVKKIFKNKAFMAYLFLALGLNVECSITLLYQAYLLTGAGVEGKFIAFYQGIRTVIELLCMLVLMRLLNKGKLTLWHGMALCGILYIIEHALYPFLRTPGALLLIMIPSGIGSGLFYGVGPELVNRIAAPEVKSTCQTLNGMCTALMATLGTLTGGIIIDRFGIYSLTTICLVILVITTASFVTINLISDRKTA